MATGRIQVVSGKLLIGSNAGIATHEDCCDACVPCSHCPGLRYVIATFAGVVYVGSGLPIAWLNGEHVLDFSSVTESSCNWLKWLYGGTKHISLNNGVPPGLTNHEVHVADYPWDGYYFFSNDLVDDTCVDGGTFDNDGGGKGTGGTVTLEMIQT